MNTSELARKIREWSERMAEVGDNSATPTLSSPRRRGSRKNFKLDPRLRGDDKPSLTIVGMLACDPRGVIGVNGKLPWNLPDDRQLFREVTQGSQLIMGRKTFDSESQNFWKGKNCVVFSRRSKLAAKYPSVTWVSSLEKFKRLPAVSKPAFMIGGAEITKLFLANHLLSHFVLTKVKHNYEGDTVVDLSALADWHFETIHESADFSVLTAVRLGTRLQPKPSNI